LITGITYGEDVRRTFDVLWDAFLTAVEQNVPVEGDDDYAAEEAMISSVEDEVYKSCSRMNTCQ